MILLSLRILAFFITLQLITAINSISIPDSVITKQQIIKSQNNSLNSYWHLKLVGPPRLDSISNQFIYVSSSNINVEDLNSNGNKQSILYTITEKNILAAIEPNSGSTGEMELLLLSILISLTNLYFLSVEVSKPKWRRV